MHFLVTRPEPDGIKLVGLLENRGHEALAAPLTSFTPLGLDLDALEGVTALIATSRNALRALVGSDVLEAARNLTVFTVGAATAEEARRMGFVRIVKGPGTGADLVPLIASLVDPAEDSLLHLGGEHLAVDLAGELGTLGVRVETRTVYRMDAATALPANVVRAIKAGDIDAVMLMSPRAAAIWARLAVRHDLVGALRQVLHLCISDAVADRLAPIRPIEVEVARRPTLEEMLALADRAAARWAD